MAQPSRQTSRLLRSDGCSTHGRDFLRILETEFRIGLVLMRTELWDLYAVPNLWDGSFTLVQIVDVRPKEFFAVVVRELDCVGAELPEMSDLVEFPEPVDHPAAGWLRFKDPLPKSWHLVGSTPTECQVSDLTFSVFDKGASRELGVVPVEFRWPLRKPHVRIELEGQDGDPSDLLDPAPDPFSFSWLNHGKSEIDLSAYGMREMTVSCGSTLERLVVPSSLAKLTLVFGGGVVPTVVHERDGRAVQLVVKQSDLVWVDGMQYAYGIEVDTGGADLDLSGAGFYPEVELARFNLGGGGCDSLDYLSSWPRLRELFIRGMHRFDPVSFPEPEMFPQLGYLSLSVIPKNLVAGTKKQLSGGQFDLSISESFEPLFVGNPLNMWVERNPKLGKRALKEFMKARKIAEEGDAEAGVKSFVAAVNKMTNTFPIETLEREEASKVADLIGIEFGATVEQVSQWFDEDRDF